MKIMEALSLSDRGGRSFICRRRGQNVADVSFEQFIPFINKADCLAKREDAYRLANFLLGRRIRRVILGSAISKDPVIDVID